MSLKLNKQDTKCRFALRLIKRLRAAGHEALLAGGCVRDLLMGSPAIDYDVATSARPEQVQRLFRGRTVAVGAHFGVILVRGRRGEGQIEVATFRREGPYSDGRHPDHVEYCSPEEDARRRDFTINGMFYDPLEGKIIDLVGGQRDIERRVIRAIGNPYDRFSEDKLRLIRAIRFAARFDFEIEPATAQALREMASQITVVSAERILQELRRMLEDPSRGRAVRMLAEFDLLEPLFPELAELRDVRHPECAADRFEHTVAVLERLGDAWRSAQRNLGRRVSRSEPEFTLAFAALLHETAEPARSRDGLKLFKPQRAAATCRRLRLSNAERDRVCWLVAHHAALRDATHLRAARLKRILIEPGIEQLLALHRADLESLGRATDPIAFCERYLRQTPAAELNPPPLVNGHDLIGLGLRPGPIFKQLLERIRDEQLDGKIKSREEALALARKLAEAAGKLN